MKKSFSLALLITTSVISGAFGGDPAHPFEPEKATVAPAAKKAVDPMADFADQHSIFFQTQVNRLLTNNDKLHPFSEKEWRYVNSLNHLAQEVTSLEKSKGKIFEKIKESEKGLIELERQKEHDDSERGSNGEPPWYYEAEGSEEPNFPEEMAKIHKTIEDYKGQLEKLEEDKKKAIQSMLNIIQSPDLQSKEVSPRFQDAVHILLETLKAHKS